MFEVTHEELDNILVQVSQAIDNHEQWYHQLVRTLVCNLPADQRDVAEGAHRLCHFGQWYHNVSNTLLRTHPTFIAMEKEHKKLHALVGQLLRQSMTGNSIEAQLYDQFANALECMQLHLYSLKHEIETEIYNLDPLTGAYTRYGMLTTLREQKQLVSRGAGSCVIAMLDIDHFKSINDQYGHQIGDRTLSHIAKILIKGLRPYDKLFRYGGEEFVIIWPNTTPEAALLISERMRELVENNPAKIDNLPIRITISIGISAIDADQGVEASIEAADRAMYAAKQAGRNRVKMWNPSIAVG